MAKSYMPVLAFLFLLLLTVPFSFDLATSVVPGWHTTVFPPFFIWEFSLTITLLFVIIGYWLLSKRVDEINWVLFAIHFILTVPGILFIKFPSIYFNVEFTNQEKLFATLSLREQLITIVWALFIAGQLLFAIYFIRALRTGVRTL